MKSLPEMNLDELKIVIQDSLDHSDTIRGFIQHLFASHKIRAFAVGALLDEPPSVINFDDYSFNKTGSYYNFNLDVTGENITGICVSTIISPYDSDGVIFINLPKVSE